MANEYSTVACCEMQATVSETWSEDAVTAQVQLMCDWTDRHSLAADILLNRRVFPALSAWAFPPRAVSCAIAMFPAKGTASGQELDYEKAIVTVAYSTAAEADLVSESLEPTVEFLTQDYRRFRWTDEDGDLLLEGEAPGVQLRGLNLVRTLYRVEPPLPAVLLTGVGGVNDTTYVSSLLGLTFAAETLLFVPPVLSRSITTAGAGAWQIGLKFSFKPNGWNKYFRAATNTWERIFSIDSGAVHNNYPLVDYSDILA